MQLRVVNVVNWQKDEKNREGELKIKPKNQFEKTLEFRRRTPRCGLPEWLDDRSSRPRRRSKSTTRSTSTTGHGASIVWQGNQDWHSTWCDRLTERDCAFVTPEEADEEMQPTLVVFDDDKESFWALGVEQTGATEGIVKYVAGILDQSGY